ncbi:beta-galactosidase-1-like protein 3 isoform X6 [Trachypithecus francoisi]|uniref:beta-galactosidase-1-like protein 3 isoform X6 n=1 Tax=Trachypithecus francoisi TaxID=54180 RepID=UPI00141B4905|nr:beta-galactosidase-1-like protein 3 isoform X6 [Trachypithecus francoisi]
MQAGAQRLDTVSFLDLVGEAPASPSPDTQPQGPALSAGSRTEGLSAASVLRSPGPGPARKTRLCRGPPPGLRPLKRPRHSFAARAARRGRHLPLVTVLLSPSSPCLSWKRMVGVFFLPCVLPAFAPRFKQEENLMLGRAHPPQPRFNWSHLTPLELKNRSVGLGTASTGRGKPHFTLEGHKFLIFGGSIHYFRVPREYWRDRLLKLKACGFNTVTTYVPWNLHEPERGKFDFSGNLDLEAFVLMAAEIGLWVILRPGPYICSEMDLGGLPSWLLRDPRLLLRTTNKGFTEAVEKYFDHLIPRVIPLQYRQGGPVIAVQVENEYGSFNKDKTYMPYLHKALLRRGIVELLLTSDGEKNVLSGHTKGVLAAINLQKVHKNTFSQLRQVQTMMLCSRRLEITQKNISSFKNSLNLSQPVRSHQAVSMENLPTNNGSGQSYGLVLYETFICSGGRLCAHAHDMAQVFLDETMIGILNENNKDLHIPELRQDCRYLRILVENQGRVNFSWQIQNEQKGITGSVSINNSSLEGFTIYSLEMKMSFFERLRSATWKPVPESHQGPAFYRGTLKAGPSPKDTFLSLLNWNYGFVFINGRNLGRYWNIGPQKTLYLPGVWLHPEDNEVILFEKMLSGSDIKSTDKPML